MNNRELDAKMAELMGECVHDWEIKVDDDALYTDTVWRKCIKCNEEFWGLNPPVCRYYSTDIAAAMLVVEKLVEMGFYVDIGVDKHGAQVQLNHYTGSEYGWTHGESIQGKDVPEAICLAALMAVEDK